MSWFSDSTYVRKPVEAPVKKPAPVERTLDAAFWDPNCSKKEYEKLEKEEKRKEFERLADKHGTRNWQAIQAKEKEEENALRKRLEKEDRELAACIVNTGRRPRYRPSKNTYIPEFESYIIKLRQEGN